MAPRNGDWTMNAFRANTVPELPASVDAEQGILGLILSGQMAPEELAGRIGPEHFSEGIHQEIFEAAITLSKRSVKPSPLALSTYFEDSAALADLGGKAYLHKLVQLSGTIIDPNSYIEHLRDICLRRGLFQIAGSLQALAASPAPDQTSIDILAQAETKLAALQSIGVAKDNGLMPIAYGSAKAIELITIAKDNPGYISGVATGLPDLDAAMRGLQPAALHILGARPSMGKTSVAGHIAVNVAMAGGTVGFYSLEMASDAIAVRMLSDLIRRRGIEARYHDALSGRINSQTLYAFQDAQSHLDSLPLLVDDRPGRSPSAIRAGIRNLIRRARDRDDPLKLIIVDHLGLTKSDLAKDNRVAELGLITQDLKAIAKDFNVAVLLCCQLSRQLTKRENKRPVLDDLRGSGEIEENADTVGFLHREEYYAAEALRAAKGTNFELDRRVEYDNARGKAEWIIAKNRNGPLTSIELSCDIACSWFGPISETSTQEAML